jgi:membrane-associated phospholipid phosphatase
VLRALDLALLRVLRTRLHQPPFERLVLRFTHLGEHGGLWVAIALLGALIDRRGRPVYLRAARVVLLTYAINTVVKLGIRRARPLLEDLPPLSPTMTGLSYPSAHASTSFAAAAILSGVLPPRPLRATACAMALSRCYIGVHYPSDVLAGALLGRALARLLP